jgi:hypothetical protein
MRLVHFLTLVLFSCTALASPDSTISPKEIDTNPSSPWLQEGAELIPVRKNAEHSFSVSLGSMNGILIDDGENRNTSYLAIEQTNYNQDFTAQNYGIELSQIGVVGLHWDFRTTWALGKYYEPCYQWGVGAIYKPPEGLGTFITYQRYQARFGLTFEDFLSLQRRLRLEMMGGLSALGFSAFVQLGFTLPD